MVQPTITLRPARGTDAPALAELILLSGENLLTRAFGGNRRDAVLSIEALCRTWGTMFTYELATVATDAADPLEQPIGVAIVHPSSANRQTGQRLAEVLVNERGLWRWLRMLPVSVALERCSEPIPHESAYVSILSVFPAYRSQGIGARLLRFGEQQASNAGDETICLDVEIDNERAIAFYERAGYTTVNEHPSSPFLKKRGIAGLRRVIKGL